ncbi:hypothetical protein [Cytobacillus dafuensis]|uniref:Uncharacterized protein n=1 Tax=Cytobacillus dafuensis TaxID=1742359 RepID=A0A5B8Z9E8_CYTDA|nr:hypothetical protein [Cytobacillus dafuensis]QED48076.1 hypothetical protein FSZ17_12960 [Cytobacillus dafuensis]
MFLDLFDTIRTSENQHNIDECKKNAIQGESMLFYLLLSGQMPILTQTQVIDSKIIHNILFNNEMKGHFLELIKNGKLRLALYTGHNRMKSLQDYFMNSLSYGLDDQTDFFDFSTLPFLKHYDPKIRKKLNLRIIESLEHNSYQFETDGVKPEHIEFIEKIIDNIQNIDRAIRGNFTYTNGFKKNLDDLFNAQSQILINDEFLNLEFLNLCREIIKKGSFNNRRSAYYSFLESRKDEYSSDSIEEVKQIVDNCYNEAIASSLPSEEYNLNFASKFSELVKPIQLISEISKKEVIKLKPNQKESYITWEILVHMLNEVDTLQKEKNLSRIEALFEFKRRQSFKPVVAISKYIGIGLIPSFIPGAPEGIEILTDLVSGAATEITDNLLKKPTLKDVKNTFKERKITSKMVDNTMEFISLTMQS